MLSKALNDATKQKIQPVLKAEFMSSEELIIEETPDDKEHSSGSDIEEVCPSRGKKSLINTKCLGKVEKCKALLTA